MFRSLLGFASIMLLLTATLVMPPDANARRCGEEPPKTLLSLYRKSTAIHIATFDRTDDFAVTDDDESYSIIEVRHRFTISSTLKGEPAKFVSISDTEYRSKNPENDETTDEHGEGSEGGEGFTDPQYESIAYGVGELKSGDQVMLFVKAGETPDQIVLTDFRGSAKKLSPERMAAFEKAVGELNGIFSAEKVSDKTIVDWLVRTAQDPLTRWEGAYELLSAVQTREWRQEMEKNIKEKVARGEKLEEWETLDAETADEDGEDDGIGNMKYADLLTDSQKQDLVNVLLDSMAKQNDAEAKEDEPVKAGQMGEGDRILLELAGRWGDDRLAVIMIDRLRINSDEAYETSQLMDKVAVMLKDDQMTNLASRYSNIFYMDADEAIDNDTVEANKEDETEDAVTKEGETEKARITYGQLRTELLSKFMARADLVLNDPVRQVAAR